MSNERLAKLTTARTATPELGLIKTLFDTTWGLQAHPQPVRADASLAFFNCPMCRQDVSITQPQQ